MSNQAMTEILAAVANGEGAADTDTVQVSLGALRALVRQEPVSWLVSIACGDEWECQSKVLAERHAANGANVRPYRYAAPVVAGQTVPDGYALVPVDVDLWKFLREVLKRGCALESQFGSQGFEVLIAEVEAAAKSEERKLRTMLAAAKNSCQQKPAVHASYECPHCGAIGSHEQDSCHLIDAAKNQGGEQ